MNIEIDAKLVEFLGIMLGDGNIYVNPQKWQYQLDISLNPIDEPKYFIHVENLMEEIYQKKPNLTDHHGKAVSLRYYKKDIVLFLVDLGLKPGKKTINQVRVPDLIFTNINYSIACLKGLFDTDGSIGIDSQKDLRLSFTNCSNPLVEDFYNICISLDIRPSPTIKYDEERNSWQVMIARKDDIRKFFEIIKPEKIKEPYRRIWLASNFIYLNSPDHLQQKISERILSWLEYNAQSSFRYSKENAIFLKNICEEILNIEISFDVINNVIANVLDLEKFMYSREKAQILKFLYEKLRSAQRVVEYLIEKAETNIPHRQTITKHLKKYFNETNQDYDLWLNENPKMRIGIDENNLVRVFPNELRNSLNHLLIEILINHENIISEFEVIRILKQLFIESDMLIMTWLLKNPKYSLAIKNYLRTLIYLWKKLVYISLNNIELNITALTKDPNIPFDRRTITLMVDYIRDNRILEF